MYFVILIIFINITIILSEMHVINKRPNIIIIVADDLGYGDTSVYPFIGSKIITPELEKMSLNGIKLTNFHSAAPICTPSRAALLTGLFPWRLSISSVFGGQLDQRNNNLNILPNMANYFKNNGYYTAHIGKWHLGGLTPLDIKNRRIFKTNNGKYYSGISKHYNDSSCIVPQNIKPGPIEHGFNEYIAMVNLILLKNINFILIVYILIYFRKKVMDQNELYY